MFGKSVLVLAVAASLAAGPAFAADFIGGLRKVKGTGTIVRGSERIAAKDGIRVQMGDRLVTGQDGAMGVIFSDNTRISVGPDSELTIDRYIYSPRQGAFAFLASVAQGTASYISGVIGKLAPDSVEIRTPTATVGIRGTHFLVKVELEK